MKYNIEFVNEELKNALKEFSIFSFDKNGLIVESVKGEDHISFEGDRLRISYSCVSRFIYLLFLYDALGYTGEISFDFDNFIVMLDMSRNAVRTVSTVKKFLRYLVLMGYTGLQLYMEDVYEIPEEPYFGYKRGRYSQAELKEIVAYARLIGLECTPAIQTLAHLNAITRWRRFQAIIDCKDILLADEEETYGLIENMLKSLRTCFDCEKINIGMDEAHMVGLGKYLDIHGYTDRASIIVRHLQRVCQIAEKYGFSKPMMWNDMFIRLANKGAFENSDKVPQHVLDLIPENIAFIGWNYDLIEKKKYIKMIRTQQKFGREVYFAGGVNSWHGVTPQNKYAIKRTAVALQACKDTGLKNFILTVWGDDGAECSPFANLPTLCFAGCKANGITQYKALFAKLTGISFDAFMRLDSPNDVVELFDPLAQPSKYMLYNDCLQGLLDCTVKEQDGEKYKQVALKLCKCAKNEEWGYLFETQRQLAKLLYIKYALGVKTRKAYQQKDKEELNKLLTDYRKLIKQIDLFYQAMKEQWFKENKGYGFEVQDYRLGGLKQRVLHCAELVQAYVIGRSEGIEELEESVLSVLCNDDSNGKGIDFRGVDKMLTANIFYS